MISLRQSIFGLVVAIAFLSLASVSFAGCARDAYNKACSSCSFDSNGKIDKSCQQGMQSSGTACVSAGYPIMSTQYAAGKCPQVDTCAADLQACTAQYGSGDDKADCQEGSVGVCYSSADECIKKAAIKCGEIENSCPGSSTAFVLLFAGFAFVKLRK